MVWVQLQRYYGNSKVGVVSEITPTLILQVKWVLIFHIIAAKLFAIVECDVDRIVDDWRVLGRDAKGKK